MLSASAVMSQRYALRMWSETAQIQTEVMAVRLIDADELREMFLYETCVFTPNDVLDYIDSTCTINAMPVVRCAACRNRTEPKCNKADDTARGITKCGYTKSPCSGRLVYLTEFCSHGEREEDA